MNCKRSLLIYNWIRQRQKSYQALADLLSQSNFRMCAEAQVLLVQVQHLINHLELSKYYGL